MTPQFVAEVMFFVTPFIIVFAYVKSLRDMRSRFGADYAGVVTAYQWKCLKGIALMCLYAALSYYHGGWQKLIGGVTFSASAFTFFCMAIYEMACGISLNHQFNFPIEKARLVARLFIIGQTISLIVLILVFQSSSTHWLVAAFQLVLLVLSLLSFYLAGTVANLIKIGYFPSRAINA